MAPVGIPSYRWHNEVWRVWGDDVRVVEQTGKAVGRGKSQNIPVRVLYYIYVCAAIVVQRQQEAATDHLESESDG